MINPTTDKSLTRMELRKSIAQSELLSYPAPERNDYVVTQSWVHTSCPSCCLCASGQVI